MSNKKNIKRLYNIIVIAAIIVALGYACSRLTHWGQVEYTDNAQVWRQIMPINARVGGFIKEVRFKDYQHVSKGDTLIIIEDAEYQLQLAQAEAQLRGARSSSSVVSAGVNTTSSNVRVASAGIEEAKAKMENAKADYERYTALLQKDAVTRQQYDNVRAAYEVAKARYEQVTQQKQSTALIVNEQQQRLSQTHAGTSVAEAQVNLARLNLNYTVIVATCDGVMSRKDIYVGQLVQPGQLLANIVADNQVWVVANYRETQLKHIAIGNLVEFTADAIPNIKYTGKVEAIAGGTGGAFSQIPIDNATGNFVKVEQRIPIRIRLTKDNKAKDVQRLLAGMNVETEVKY